VPPAAAVHRLVTPVAESHYRNCAKCLLTVPPSGAPMTPLPFLGVCVLVGPGMPTTGHRSAPDVPRRSSLRAPQHAPHSSIFARFYCECASFFLSFLFFFFFFFFFSFTRQLSLSLSLSFSCLLLAPPHSRVAKSSGWRSRLARESERKLRARNFRRGRSSFVYSGSPLSLNCGPDFYSSRPRRLFIAWRLFMGARGRQALFVGPHLQNNTPSM
jgi:hypothetical protein